MVDINRNPPWFRTASRCRYSNLPVSHPDIYISKHPGTNYFVDMAKLGDQIFLMKESGYVRSYEMTDITHLKEVESKLISYQLKLKKLSIRLSKSEEIQRRQ